MKNRLLISFIAAVFLNYCGCSTIAILTPAEMIHNEISVMKVMLTGMRGEIEIRKAKTYLLPPMVTGKVDDGREVKFNIDDVEEFRIKDPADPKIITKITIDSITECTRLDQIVKDKLVYSFNEEGGKILKGGFEITGINERGLNITVSSDSVLYVSEVKSGPGTALIVIGGVAMLYLIIAFAYWLSSPDTYIYW